MSEKMRFISIGIILALSIFFAGCGKNPFGSDVGELLPISEIRPLEDEMFDMINSDRADSGLGALVENDALRQVARDHSEDMYLRDFFDHVNPDGESPADRADNAGIDYVIIGENIQMNSGHSNPVEYAEEALMASSPHRANILSDEYNAVGVGIASDGDKYYFTQLFAELSTPTYEFITTIYVPAKIPWSNPFETFNEAWNR
ncbi:CAP domain-containing protein [bacterium]|nr:CAP domain-containing protein [bacterium]